MNEDSAGYKIIVAVVALAIVGAAFTLGWNEGFVPLLRGMDATAGTVNYLEGVLVILGLTALKAAVSRIEMD